MDIARDPGRRSSAVALASGLASSRSTRRLAAWSGTLSPTRARPLLDGLGPAANYRWVSPPPELASTNQPPSAGGSTCRSTPAGSAPRWCSRPTARSPWSCDGDRSARPKDSDPSSSRSTRSTRPTSPRPGANWRPSATPTVSARRTDPRATGSSELDGPIDVILVYPATADLHASEHEVLWSANGRAWEPLETTDSAGAAAGGGPGARHGLRARRGRAVAFARADDPGAATGAGGASTVAVALLVSAGVVLLIGIGLLIRGRSR